MRSLLLPLLLLTSATTQAAELKAPDQADLDSKVMVEVVGEVDARAFVTIVAPDAGEGSYDSYEYTSQPRLQIRTPAGTGDYEVRLLDAQSPYPTLARRPIRIVQPGASLQAPDEQPIGTAFTIEWAGPSQNREYITLVPADAADGNYDGYAYAEGDGKGTVTLTTPTTPGDYELRFMTGHKNKVLARRPLRVGDSDATVTAPATVAMGASFEAGWTGPDNARNFLTVVAPDAATGAYDLYAYTSAPSVTLVAPETPGEFEVRLVSADSTRVLARKPISVQAAQASIKAPASVEAGSTFQAGWTGPGNELDYLAVTEVGKPEKYLEYTYTRRGNPLDLRAPRTPGDYELHYLTGRTDQTLASQPLRVTPAAKPGTLRVVSSSSSSSAAAAGAGAGAGADATGTGTGSPGQGADAVELILDASGSMLQRLGNERRIDIARKALASLVQDQLADGTRVALRVFGHRKPDACDTELLAPLAPLDRAALAATVRGIEAKNLAKTPIGASLEAVADDLAGVEGRAVVVLVTDGEETCGGDPAAAIAKLKASGFQVSLNIVGFAIDEFALEQQFREWARLGNGAYFAATDADGLASGISQATQPAVYTVLRGNEAVASGVVGGQALDLAPGTYTVRIGARELKATIASGEETVLSPD